MSDADDPTTPYVRVTLDALEVAVQGGENDSLLDVIEFADAELERAVEHAETLRDQSPHR